MSISTTTPLIAAIPLNPNAVTNYFGSIIFIAGVLGESLNIIVFLSLRTFRESSCAFYLTVSSTVKLIQLFICLLSRLVTSAASVDWTAISPFFCKFRAYFLEFCPVCALSFACLAVIDQFFATSTRPRWQQWCHIKIAYRLSILLLLFSLLIAFPQATFFALVASSTTNTSACVIINKVFQQYNTNFNLPTVYGPLPLLITIIFALLTYGHVKQLAYRTVPLVRRRLDQQLTTMVLVQTLFNVIFITPYISLVVINNYTTLISDPATSSQTQFALSILSCIYYLYTAVSIIYLLLLKEFILDCMIYLEFILYLCLYIGTISSSTTLCSI